MNLNQGDEEKSIRRCEEAKPPVSQGFRVHLDSIATSRPNMGNLCTRLLAAYIPRLALAPYISFSNFSCVVSSLMKTIRKAMVWSKIREVEFD